MIEAPYSLLPLDDRELHPLLEAISRASHELLELWPGGHAAIPEKETSSTLGVQIKEDGSLVSQADFRSNEILTAAIRTLFPHDKIISEEGVGEGTSNKEEEGRKCWIIDPLDGTTSFLHGRDDFSILVGCWQRGVPLVGIMNFPVRKLLVIAQTGEGCWVNGTVAKVSNFTEPRAGRVYMRNFTPRYPELACTARDSGLALLEVATGELDAAIIKMTTHRVWDIAAPIVAIREAGGSVTDERGNPVQCVDEELNIQYLIATNSKCHSKALTLVDT